ncbi:hypothetical protein GIB67_033263 [Kingdonia uniflora]|uniref:Uncharacterized protein n=1 Tax=Kingdonia uniflora TaxID=39325 RepID=A0A7J7MPM8_9MAGN|nr:hypothetical protein GIB67_033263 [Kingdonia uniflora]
MDHIHEESMHKKDEIEKKNEKQQIVKPFPFHKLLSYADSIDWLLMGLGTLGSIVHGMAQPMGYLLLGKALDAFGNNIKDTDAMVKALYKVVPFVWYMAIATFPAGILEIGCWMYTSERQLVHLRLAYLSAVLHQDVGAFDTDLTNGKIIAGMTNHISLIQDAIGFHRNEDMLTSVYWMLGVVGTPETISQIKTVFAFVGESSAIKSFSECMVKQSKLSKSEAIIKGVGTGMLQTVTFCSWALIVWIGAIVVTAHRSNGGDTLAAVMSILFGAISLTHAAPDMQTFNQAKAAGNEVFQIIQRKPTISYEAKGIVLDKIIGNIEIREVYFAYPSREHNLILQGFSLPIRSGTVVALVGSSGCGKSTIISLIERFYDPSIGDIYIDNHNIKDLDLKFLRKNIGAVSQEPSLFAGTIMDNIKIGNMNASKEQIERAALTANAHSFISLLPEQYSTEVGERGVQLSGGQKQRIAIARAILKDPPILFLDEATSALDSESEKLVQDALENAMKGRTVILIAHRMSTIINADTIVVVENGVVAETGTHCELLDSSNFYNKLFNMQNLAPESDSRDAPTKQPEDNSHTNLSQEFEQTEVSRKEDDVLQDISNQYSQSERTETISFFRIWFGLDKTDLGKTVIGSVAAALSGISKPIFGYFIITIGVAYYKPDARLRVGWYSIGFGVIGLLSLGTHTLQHYVYGVIGDKAMTNLRQALYSVVLKNEIAWFEKPKNSVGALTSQIINDSSMIKTIISDRMSVIVQCISSILIATIVSMIVNWRMGLVAWAVMPCHFIGGLIQAKSSKGFSGDLTAAHQELVSLTSESTTNIKTIASFVHEDHILEKAKLSLEVPLRKSRRKSIKYGIIQGVSLCLWNIAHAVALWYTTVLVNRKQASFEDGIRSYQIFSLTVPSITELWTLIPTVISAINILTPAFQTLDRKTMIDPTTPEDSNSERIKGRIEFEKISFSYPSRPGVTILNNFTLLIEAGSKVALVGPSGAGKSSVLALLLRFYDIHEGRILIDSTELREFNLRWLRSQVGLVQQEPLLFSSTIRDNICYGNEGASETEVMEASMEANIHEFVSNLPDGYNTLVGEKGCQLSGGQKQRIAIARTLLKRPAILLLDEATSALDADSERVVMSAFGSNDNGRLLSGATQIIVAHRLSTVMNSDIIVVMDKGEVAEMGSHSTLIGENEGVYSRLFKLQSFAER